MPPATCTKYTAEVLLVFVGPCLGHPYSWPAQSIPLGSYLWHVFFVKVFVANANATHIYNLHKVYHWGLLCVFVGQYLGHPHPAHSMPHIYNLHKVYHWSLLCVFVGQYLGHPHPAQSMPLYSLCVCGPVFRPPTASTKSATGVLFVCLRVNK